MGYSQGGSVALATQYYIEKYDSDDRLRLKGSLCGDGPYDPFATYSRYAKDDYQLYLPSVITLILRGYLYYYKDTYLKGFTVEDYLKPEVIAALKNGTDNVWNMIDSKEKSTTDIDTVIKNAVGEKDSAHIPVSKMLTEKAMDPNSDAYKALKKALDANNITDPTKWAGGKNKKTIAAMHWKCDEVVPYKNYEFLKNNLTINDKDWNPTEKTVIEAIDAFLRTFGISDALKDVTELFDNEPKVSNGSHSAAGKLFFAGNIFYRQDYKHLND